MKKKADTRGGKKNFDIELSGLVVKNAKKEKKISWCF